MGNQQIESEMAELREQLEMLRRAQAEETPSPEPSAEAEAELDLAAADAQVLEDAGLSDQLQELMGRIDQELKESNPKALLAVFALGILIGRLLPR
jgi:ElaB/YqjD/DUF883 family membrane-anchored ribosome-binding protein